jgi:hypothetical protein
VLRHLVRFFSFCSSWGALGRCVVVGRFCPSLAALASDRALGLYLLLSGCRTFCLVSLIEVTQSARMSHDYDPGLVPIPSSSHQQALPSGFSQPKRRGVGRPRKADSYQNLRKPRGSSKPAPPAYGPDPLLTQLESDDPRSIHHGFSEADGSLGTAAKDHSDLIRLDRGSCYLDHVISAPHHASTYGVEQSKMHRITRALQPGCQLLWSGSTLKLPQMFDNWVS